MSGQGDRRRSYGIEEGKNNIREVGSFWGRIHTECRNKAS